MAAGFRHLATPQLPAMVASVTRTHTIGGHERLWVGTGTEGLWYREDGESWQRFHDPRFDATQIENTC